MPCSPLSNPEWEERGFSREPTDEKDIEAFAMEPDGSAVVWSSEGKAVRIPQEDKEGVAVLLLEGRITNEDTFKMLNVAEQTDSLVLRSELLDVIDKLLRFVPRPQQPAVQERIAAIKNRGVLRVIA